jgi:hypothetical protein
MRTPVFGDLVYEEVTENSTIEETHARAIGYLISQENDEILFQSLDGQIRRQRNALIRAIPGERKLGDALEISDRAKQFAADGEISSLNHLAKVIRFFGFRSHQAMIAPSGPTYDIYQRMTYPELTDLVFEMTTMFRSNDDQHSNAVGHIIERSPASRSASDDFTRIRTLDGREMTWTNATFLAIPGEHTTEDQPSEEDRYYFRG